MEYIVLYNYWKKFHKKEKREIKQVWDTFDKKLRCICIDMIIIIIFSIIIFIVSVLAKEENIYLDVILPIFVSLWSLISMILLYIYIDKMEEMDIEKINENIKKKKDKYAEVNKWLKEIGFTKKHEISQFCMRCEEKLKEMECERKDNKNQIETVFMLVYVPTLLSIISWILSTNQTLNDMYIYIFVSFMLASLGAFIYLLYNSIRKGIDNFGSSDIKKMKYMIQDIYGVLDYCHEQTQEDED